MSHCPDLKALLKIAEERGWTTEKRKGHLRWLAPDGSFRFSSSSTPSDRNSARAVQRDLRRNGVETDPRRITDA